MTSLLLKQVSTEILLPPGILSRTKVRELLRLCLETHGWLKPVSYEIPTGSKPIGPGQSSFDEMIKLHDEQSSLLINGRTERAGLGIYSSPVYRGHVGCWWPNDKIARSDKSREAHAQQVAGLMRLLDSPLAYAAIYEDRERKTQWHVDGRITFVGDYNEGLLGLFWRTFLGPPFVRLFGERLATLPPGTARDLGGDIWLIEPYPMPADALTREGRAREQALIEHLGKECFFDHERQLKATRRPELPFLDEEAAWREHNLPKYEKEYGRGSPQVEVALKIDEIFRWASRHSLDRPHPLLDGMKNWARAHRNDPDFVRWTPEQVAEEVRVQQEEEAATRSAGGPEPERDRGPTAPVKKVSRALDEVPPDMPGLRYLMGLPPKATGPGDKGSASGAIPKRKKRSDGDS